ncbi:MAG: hypothetical protein ABI789_00210 [Usitatibacter sp.]
MTLPEDPVDLAVLALMVITAPFILWYMGRHLLSGFLPAYRLKVPKPGKLTGILTPHLQSFVAALPRRPNDPLAETCKPIAPGTLPYFDNHVSVNAVFPLWKSGSRYCVAARSWAKRRKERTDFVWCGDKPDDKWDIRAYSEQGFLADTMIEVMTKLDWTDRDYALDRAKEAAKALGFKYHDETVKWFDGFATRDWTQPIADEEEGDDYTPKDREDEERWLFVGSIDKRELPPS